MNVRVCRTGKKGYETAELARAEVERIVDRHKPEESGRKVPSNYNACPYCGEYHLTRDESWGKRKPKNRNGKQPWSKR